MSYGISHRCSSDPTLLWLWCRPAAAAPICPLAWELTYAVGAALKKKKKKVNSKVKSKIRPRLRSLYQLAFSSPQMVGFCPSHNIPIHQAEGRGPPSSPHPSLGGTAAPLGCSPKHKTDSRLQVEVDRLTTRNIQAPGHPKDHPEPSPHIQVERARR